MPRYPFTKMIPSRWPFYTFTIVCALFQTFVAFIEASPNDAKYQSFATACAALAICTFIWICMLLCYSRSETEYQHIFTRCYTHIASFGVIAVLWFGLGIFFAIHAEIECHRHTPVCLPLWFSTLLAFLTFLSSCLCVVILMSSIAVSGVGYNTHVEDARERAQHSATDRQQPETEDAPTDQNNDDGILLPNLSRPRPALIY